MSNSLPRISPAFLFACLLAMLQGLPSLTYAQEIRFSQYQAVPMMLNPANAGILPDYTLNINYRVQNVGFLAYRSTYASFSVPFYDKKQEPRQIGGLALGFVSDVAGQANEIITTGASLSFAYQLRFDSYGVDALNFGLQTEFIQTRVDFGVLNWPSQVTYYGFDPGRRPDQLLEGRDNYLRFNAGLVWTHEPGRNKLRAERSNRFHLGFAASNLNTPSMSFISDGSYQVPLLYRMHGGADLLLNRQLSLSPAFLMMLQNQLFQYNIGAILSITKVVRSVNNPGLNSLRLFAGSWYRSSDALVFMLGASGRTFHAAVSYDANAFRRKAGIQAQGAFELSLAIKFLKEASPRKLSTPLF
ncbi:MAG: PorP/SprF family type IX secretion system membrane protein [Cyclobacteriaceae bacterium]